MAKLIEIENMLRDIIKQSNVLIKQVQELKQLTTEYRIEVYDRELLKHCDECGGEIKESAYPRREHVCCECGLVAGPIYVISNDSPYKHTNESNYQKGLTKWKPAHRIEKLPRKAVIKTIRPLHIYKEAHAALKEITGNKWGAGVGFLSELIREEICDEHPRKYHYPEPTLPLKQGNVYLQVRDEFKAWCKTHKLVMKKVASAIIIRKHKEVFKK